MAARPAPAVRPLLLDRPLGFDPRWIVRHAIPCARPAARLVAPRYIGGTLPTVVAKTRRPAFTLGEYRALRRRLDRWELEHLREHAADLAEQLDAERRARADAEDSADSWREQAMNVELRDGERLGLAMDGSVHVVAADVVGAKGGAA